MKCLRIFVDLAAPADALDLLRRETAGHQLIFAHKPAASVLDKGEVDPQVANIDVAFGQPDTEAISRAPHVRWVHVSSSGITRYDNPAFRTLMAERGIALTNSASVYAEPCAVHLMAFMLAQARNLPVALHDRSPNGSPVWDLLRGTCRTLRGETVLMVGYGAIARRLVELLSPFLMNVLAYRRRPRGDEPVAIVAPNQLTHVLSQADHIVNILPDSADTRHFFDEARFNAMKPGAVFYNIGRGATVEQEALCQALSSGRIRAAWLDVTEPEPLPDDHPLRTHPNCFVTPHIAGGHFQEANNLVRHFLLNLNRYIRDEPLLDRVM